MEIGELFTFTVKKMKRLDFISDFIRRKTSEKNKLSEEVAVYRKKNGKIKNNEYDIYIYQTNAKISEIEKSVEKCKIEAKALRGEISEGLRECYAKSPDADFLKRTERAYKHVFGDKSFLLGYGEAGGIFGETKIVGAVVTHDKSRRCAVKECVSAGEKNQAGRIISKPRIIVWDYDKNKTEGEFRPEDDSFKAELKKRKKSELSRYTAEVFTKPLVWSSILVALVVSAMLALCVFSGLTENVINERFVYLFAVFAVVSSAFTAVAVVRAVPSSLVDGAGVAAFVFSLCSGAIYAATEPVMIAFLPAFSLVYSIVVFTLRFYLRKKVKTGVNMLGYAAVGGGVFLAVLLNGMSYSSLSETIAAAVVYFSVQAFGLAGVIYSLVKRKGNPAAYCYFAAVFSSSFSCVAALLTSGSHNIGSIISFSVAVVTFVLCVIKRIKDEI
ncbi:MAG: hypothetical protein MR437_04675 [Clostridiales bacterium]|nr:hypothetical protein [Clostridiales bacterium]